MYIYIYIQKVPKIDNTNVDRSLAILHTVVVIRRSVCVLCVNVREFYLHWSCILLVTCPSADETNE